jgi:hypothetical protein
MPLDGSGALAVYAGGLFGVEAAAIAGLVAIAIVGKARSVPVVANSQDAPEVGGGDHGADSNAAAGRTQGKRPRKLQVDGLEAWGSGMGSRLVRGASAIGISRPSAWLA